ncbi:MAG: Wzz/FepE/Etk N-terminal domain-containing protein, partial [Pseudomonadota bacterium]
MDQVQAIRELLSMLRRRAVILISVSLVGVLVSGFIAYVLPPVFEAQARILVNSQQIPDQLARSTVTASAVERLRLIEQRLMTRDNLLQVIEDIDLFADRDDLSISDQIDILRQATSITPIQVQDRRTANATISAFTIKVTFSDAGQATRIANEFVTTVLDQNLRTRSERATETKDFFEQQEEGLTQSLNTLETQISNYKRENEAALPESLNFRRDQLSRLDDQDLQTDRQILQLEEERSLLESGLAAFSAGGGPQRSPEELELRRLEAQLAQKRAVLSENHREVRTLVAQVDAIKAQIPDLDAEAASVADDERSIRERATEQKIRLINDRIDVLNAGKVERDKLRTALEESIQKTPSIEMVLIQLERERDELQQQLTVAVRKRAEAETGEKLELNQQAER